MTEQSPQVRMRALMTRIKTEGAEIAFEAALDLLKDKNASAQARASGINSMWRAGGFFDTKKDAQDKPPEEMTMAEIQARISRLQSDRDKIEAGLPIDDDDDQEDGQEDG